MDLQQQRMECLKMAFELRGNTDPIVSAAQQLFEFVTGTQASQATEVAAEPATSAEAPTEEQVAVTPSETPVEAPSAEAIAACGTALVLPESGELADAVPPAQPEQQAAQPQPEDGAEATEAAAPTEAASEPEAHASEPQATSEAPEQGAAPQSGPVIEDQELAASKVDVEQATEPAPETQSEAEPPASPETEAKPAEEAVLASAPANSSETV
jgi:hypothetical protein